jgi:tetratricopeptide (TPR) repeat protein
MNTALERRLPEDTRLALGRFLVKLRVARAAELARAGELSEAEATLKQRCDAPHTADELDLLARIATRQGRFEEACRLWEAALHQVPGNE